MKIKRTFVTNSSTCSFVFLGFELPKDKTNYKDLIDYIFPNKRSEMEKNWKKSENQQQSLPIFTDYDYQEIFREYICDYSENEFEVLDGIDAGALNDDSFIIGFTILTIEEYETTEMDVMELTEKINDVTNIKNKLGVKGDTKLYGSIKMC